MSFTNGQESTGPLVTVIILTYNRLALLCEAVDSVRLQTWPDWELVIVDDGSTDGTVEAIRSLNDSRIRVLVLQHSGHLGVLRNQGAAVAKGKWLAYLDSDDLWLPDKLEKQLSRLAEEKRRWNYGKSQLIDKDGNIIAGKDIGKLIGGRVAKEVINTEIDFSMSSIVIEKELFENLGGYSADPRLFHREDIEFALRLALATEASVVEDTVALIRVHHDRSSNFLDHHFERSAELYRFCLDYHLTDKTHRKLATQRMAHHLTEAGIDSMLEGKLKKGAVQLWCGIKNGDRFLHVVSAMKRGIRKQVLR
jgi:glycosyltransferase involved in cell wall biosynthesis